MTDSQLLRKLYRLAVRPYRKMLLCGQNMNQIYFGYQGCRYYDILSCASKYNHICDWP